MSEKYIRQNKNSYTIVKNSKTYARISNLDDAIFIRDLLINNDWDLTKTPQIIKKDDSYLVLTVHEDKIRFLGRYKQKPDGDTVNKLIKKHKRNPNDSKYGLNIVKVFDIFAIKKQIAGDDYIFGYYDNLQDAQFVRNVLMDNQWNVCIFKNLEFDEDTKTYKAVKVFDDKVYILDSFNTPNIDFKKVYGEFLSKIYKHKYGLASYPHLEPLVGHIDELESEFGIGANDENWSFDNVDENALNQIIFNLTPFQQSVFDAIEGKSTFEDIKKKLIRYRSKNFENKINKNLDELCDLNLIEKQDDYYIKIK